MEFLIHLNIVRLEPESSDLDFNSFNFCIAFSLTLLLHLSKAICCLMEFYFHLN